MSDEIDIKTERLVEMLERENLGGVLLNAQHNFAWITGGGMNGVDRSREGAGGVLDDAVLGVMQSTMRDRTCREPAEIAQAG